MNIEVRDKVASDYILQVGDVVEGNKDFGLVFLNKVSNRYTVIDLEDGSDMMDDYSSLEKLTESANSCELKFYSKSKYKLVLEKK